MHHKSNATFELTEQLPAPEYWEWSDQELRWVVMTFDEHRTWLMRPELDPVEFARAEMALVSGNCQ